MTIAASVFIDTSAIIAILAAETGHETLIERMEAAEALSTSPLVILEASMRLSSMFRIDPVDAEKTVRALLEGAGVMIVPIDDAMGRQAVSAFQTYGKGRGHPAQLNLADCFSYAAARKQGSAILFVGNDFSQTDLIIA